jgi:hypothetical protein
LNSSVDVLDVGEKGSDGKSLQVNDEEASFGVDNVRVIIYYQSIELTEWRKFGLNLCDKVCARDLIIV